MAFKINQYRISNYRVSLFLFISFLCIITTQSFAQVSANLVCNQPDGWMPGGWGTYSITVTNTSQKDTVLLKGWSLNWAENKGKNLNELNKKLAPGEVWKKNETGHLPQSIVDKAGKKPPVMEGVLATSIGNKQKDYPLKLAIPAAYLPEEMEVLKKGDIAISMMKSRFSNFKTSERTLNWLNQSYEVMEDLVGGKPYGGKTIVFKESPENPYFAYAGQEIILNTKFVENSIKEFESGLLPFGWIHEMGHDFDEGIGQWYNWNGPAAEWQGNFKLCYAVEMIKDQSFKITQAVGVADYPIPAKGIRLDGADFVRKSFYFFGDKYLSDNSRSWTTLSSDEMHSLFQRIQCMYGWDVYKGWYRTYRKLNEKGFTPPKSNEDKINLIVAILSKECKVDLVPLFQRWRFPVSKETVDSLGEKYQLNENLVLN